MSADPLTIQPEDNTGSETFARFRYQAHAAVPLCVDCACNETVLKVVAEHFEDIAVETSTGWRFVQVKTRDASLGPWKLAHLLGDHGALRSLLRTHRSLGDGDYTLEAHLEGALATKDDIQGLLGPNAALAAECRDRIAERLELDEPELSGFVSRLKVVRLPPREFIEDRNLKWIGANARALTHDQVKEVYDRLVDLICLAMEGAQTLDLYPGSVIDPASVPDLRKQDVEAKQLTRERLLAIVASLCGTGGVLIRRMDSGDYATVLEQKLVAGGAPDYIIEHAKSLRANATSRRLEIITAGGLEEDLESVQEVLRIRADSQTAAHESSAKPAVDIWTSLYEALSTHGSRIDPRSVFGQSPELLLGEVCDLADRCIVNWGTESAR